MDNPCIVYGAKGSGSVAVEAALTLLGLPYQVVESATWRNEEERAKVRAVNPMLQVPALVLPSGEVMTESAAILIWLADGHPEARLAPPPADPRRAQFLRWMIYVPAAIYSMFWVRDVPSRLAKGKAAQEVIKQRTSERIAECWGVMDGLVEPGPYLMGAKLGVLDLLVTVVSRWSPGRARFFEVAPRLAEVVKLVDAEPRLKAFWDERFPFKAPYA